ncbi:MAG: hypothetical protein V1720_19615 [bacterium]
MKNKIYHFSACLLCAIFVFSVNVNGQFLIKNNTPSAVDEEETYNTNPEFD